MMVVDAHKRPVILLSPVEKNGKMKQNNHLQ